MRNSNRLHIDLETYSNIDLQKCGAYRYAQDPHFEILLFAYAWDDGPVQVIDIAQGELLPKEVMDALGNPHIIKTAHNANFERTCLHAVLHSTMPPEQWECTAVRAAMLGLPRSLEDIGKVLGLDEDKQKLRTGKQLIQYFCKPCASTHRNGGRTRNLPHHDPDRWALFKEYCGRDVESEREILHRMDAYPAAPETEYELWALDQRMNDEGVLVENRMVQNILAYKEQHQDALLDRVEEISGISNAKSLKQMKAWLEECGYDTKALNKEAVKKLIEEIDDEEVIEVLQIRQQLGKTSVSKYEAMDRAKGRDNRIRGMLKFYGAGRTARWSGKIVQLQNLPKNTMENLELARELVLENDFEMIDLLFPSLMDVLSQLIRTALIPRPGHTFIVADYSAIEARVIAWLAQEQWRLDIFASHGKIYEASASKMFKIPIESITKGSPERAKGKVAELALGYQGAVGALMAMGASDMGLTENEMKTLVQSWRKANPHIVKFWSEVEEAAMDALTYPGQEVKLRNLKFKKVKDTLFITLPSGRALAYKNARLVAKTAYRTEIIYDGIEQDKNRWGIVHTYGGKLVENITQATARDCLAEAMLRLEKAGYRPQFHVHDEVIIEVPEDAKEDAMDQIQKLMAESTAWSKGLLLTADAYETKFYQKD